MRALSSAARSCCKNQYLVTLTFAPLQRNRGSRAQTHKNFVFFDSLLLRQDRCLSSSHLSCLSSRHLSCLNRRHLSCLNRRHPGWLFQPWNSWSSGLELVKCCAMKKCQDSPCRASPTTRSGQDDGSSTNSLKQLCGWVN